MIIGHYAVGFAASRSEPDLPLWQSMIAVVWLDILHSSMVILGVEKAMVVPGITAVVPIDLIHYPYSHSLVASVVWSLLAYGVTAFGTARSLPKGTRRRVGIWAAACVFSHFVLDLVTHRPDLPLVFGEPKFGLGLWNSLVGTFVIENVLLFGTAWLYLRRRTVRAERNAVLVLCVVGSGLFFTFPITTFPDDIRYTEAVALAVYAIVPLVAFLTRSTAASTVPARASASEAS